MSVFRINNPTRVITFGIIIMLLLNGILFPYYTLFSPENENPMDNNDAEEANPVDHGTRAAFTSGHIHPFDVANSDGDVLSFLDIDEDAVGDGIHVQSGDTNEPSVDWVEVYFPNAGLPSGAIINEITYYFGYYTNDGWLLTTDALSNVTWRVGGTQYDVGNYTLTNPPDPNDTDTILVQTTNLPPVSDLNLGSFKIRFRGIENGAAADNFYLDYCYFTVNYTLLDIVINEIKADPSGGYYNDGWQYRKKITIHAEKVVDDLTDFPVLLNFTDSDLANDAREDGYDILFSMDGESKFDHEIEQFNGSSGELVAWVRIPSLSSTEDTVFYMYYGRPGSSDQSNPTGVWDVNYTAVWHLNETGTGAADEYDESTSNDFDGQGGGGTAADVPSRDDGKMAGGQLFDAAGDYIDASTMNPQSYTSFTISVWHKSTNDLYTNDGYIFAHYETFASTPSIGFIITDDGGTEDSPQVRLYGTSTQNEDGGIDVVDQQYHYLVLARNSNKIKIYVDGYKMLDEDDDMNGATITVDATSGPFIGDAAGDTEPIDGILDELRVSDSERSAEWILTEYNNQYSPSSFHTVGIEENNQINRQYRKTITINSSKVTGDLTNYPVLVSLTDSDLSSKARSDGLDITFTLSDGTRLDYEIEDYDNSTGALVAWVRIPTLSSSTDTTVYIYYGHEQADDLSNPTGVWDSNYVAVWHMSDDPSGSAPQIKDSTSTASDGTSAGSMTSADLVTGKIDGAIDFEGTDDSINFGNPSELQITGAITLEAWFKPETSVQNDYLLTKMGGAGSRGWDLSFDDDAGIAPDGWIMFRYSLDGTSMSSEGYERVNVSEWYYAVGVFNPSTYERFYLNGVLESEDTTGVSASQYDPSVNVYLARYAPGGSFFEGVIDEVRISNSVRSSDWVNASYNNLNDISSFLYAGTEQSNNYTTSYEWVELYNSGSSSIDLSGWNLTDNDGNRFNLTGAGSIPAGGYLVCHLGKTGTNSSTDVYGAIWGSSSYRNSMLDYTDDLALLASGDGIIDYVAWGEDAGSDDDSAVSNGLWTSGTYIDTRSIQDNMTLGRDKDSTDTNSPSDWEGPETSCADPYGVHAGGATPGAINLDQFVVINEVMFSPTGGPYGQDWSYRKKITILSSQVDSDLTEFPMLLRITDTDLKNKAQSDGDDIMFVAADNDTKLDHEIEKYDSSTGELIAWIKIPELSASQDTIIYMYYGDSDAADQQNPEEVWSNGYVGVYHMKESTGAIGNSASSKFHGGRVNSPTQGTGQFGYAQNFSGGTDYDMFILGNFGLSDGVNENISFSVWMKLDKPGSDNWGTVFSQRNSQDTGYINMLNVDDLADKRIYGSIDGNTGSTYVLGDDTWTYVTMTYDGSTKSTYINDSSIQDEAQTGAIDATVSSWTVGGREDWGEQIKGYLDEIRFSSVARSAAWVKTEYNNQYSPDSFYCVNGEDINPSNWSYRKPITINSSKVSDNLDQFPVLVSITDSDLASKARSDGYDIVFTDWDGKSRLHHEIESYNSTSGELVAWVKVANLSSSTDTLIYMYYNNSDASNQENEEGVWSNGYVGVYHMLEETGSIANSASSTYDGTRGDTPTRITGRIGYGQEFTGSAGDDRFIFGDLGLTDGVHDKLTLSFWLNIDNAALDDWARVICKRDETDSNTLWGANFNADPSDKDLSFEAGGDSGGYTIGKSVWVHVSFTYDGSLKIHYHNGSQVRTDSGGSGPISSTTSSAPVTIGGRVGGSQNFGGILDEVRISDVPRSVDWVGVGYNNTNDTVSFLYVGSEESSPSSTTTTSYEWVELYNPSSSTSNLNDLYLSDYDGNLFDLSGAGTLAAGAYLMCYLGQSGTNTSTELYGPIINSATSTSSMLGAYDDLSVKSSQGYIFDYLAWGANPGTDDSIAVYLGVWTDCEYVDTSELLNNETIGRDKKSTDLNNTADWENATGYADPFGKDRSTENGSTPGAQNIDPLSGAPEITNIIASPGVIFSGGNINITGMVTDLDGVFGVWLNVTLPDGGYINSSMINPIANNWYYNDSYTMIGLYQFSIWANDTLENWVQSSVFQFEVQNRIPSLSAPQVNPVVGSSSAGFNFTVIYTDLDNHAPDIITVNITSVGVFALIEVDALDVDHTDGKGYYVNLSGFSVGSYSFNFAANDTIGDWTESPTLLFDVLDSAPLLSMGQASPSNGFTDSWFNFSVRYTDIDNQPPDIITVNVTGQGVYGLIEVNSSDLVYTDGKDYFFNISGFAVGTYFFNFAANDTGGNWSESATFQLDVVNRVPLLSFEQVNPNSGNIDTWFNYTVTYTDFDDHATDRITVNISGLGVFDLTETDSLDIDYTDGKEYYYDMSGFALGTYSFNFAANDTIGDWAESSTLQFDVINRIPQLSFDQVIPTTGFTYTWYNFSVSYTDLDNHAPDLITVNITGVGVFDLLEIDSLDVNYTDGKNYYFNVSGFTAGTYSFHFAANDTIGNWIESAVLQFDVLNNIPILSMNQVSPSTGFTDDGFNFSVIYTDPDNQSPNIITVNITGVGIYDLVEADPLDNNYSDGKLFYVNVSGFSVDTYLFHFATNDSDGNWNESGILQFDVINRIPQLSSNQVNPNSGFTDTWFNYTVTYTDLDNHAPDIITVNISGVGVFGLLETDSLDTDYTDGKEYYYNTSGFAVGTYSFHFAANDTIGDWTESAVLQFDVVNRIPTLSSEQVIPAVGYIDTWFNLSVVYTDLDNHAPNTITVNISGVGVYTLIEVDPLDVDYSNGKEYYYNASGFGIGSYSSHFAAEDIMGDWIESTTVLLDVINRGPSLVTGQVAPGTGFIDSWFNFTVNYIDPDDQPPGIITVNISGSGIYGLSEVDPGDIDYMDGKGYYWNSSGFALGIYSFHFAASDSQGNWTESGILQFDVINRIPILTSEQVDPTIGFTDSSFNFTVTYTDLDNHAPSIITVNITGLGVYGLNEVDPLDTDFTDGKSYQLIIISGFAVGSYSFNFAACDTIFDWIESGLLQFDVVNRDPSLSNGQVSPTTGFIDNWYNFTVTYIDLDNHAPYVISVNITGFGVYSLMEFDSLDTDYTNGKSYYYNISGFALGPYSFNFGANDTIGTWTESSIFQFDVINRAPTLSSDQVNPNTGNTDTWFNFSVIYSDLDDHAPSTISVNITSAGVFDLMEVDSLDTDYTDGKEYCFNISGFAVGSYNFYFIAEDIVGNWTQTSILGFNVANRQPTLLLGNVTPQVGLAKGFYNFSVTYNDLDNHPPATITANITNFGIFNMIEVDPLDFDYSDGKEYYYITPLSVGSYSFHFSANDSLGLWAQETPESFAPDVSPIPGVLEVSNCTFEFSDEVYLNATLLDSSNNPIDDEIIEFYIDINMNGIYEIEEQIGWGLTLAGGSISMVYTANLSLGIYNFTAKYNGSEDYLVADEESLLFINPKPATLTAESKVVEMGVTVMLNASLTDSNGKPIENEKVIFYIDKNKNSRYDPSEFIVLSTTSVSGIASINYYVDFTPGNYGFGARYIGSQNYLVSEIGGLLTVQSTGNRPPQILGFVPHQIKPEDSLPWTLYLTPYEDDIEDSGTDLNWYLTGVDTTLYTVTGMNSPDDLFTFIPKENAYGSNEVILWLADSNGDKVSQALWVNLTPVNDLPYFDPLPPNLYVHFDDYATHDDDPSPWDYTFYVHDVETPISDLYILTSEPTVDSGDGYAEVDGLKVTFHYPEDRVGESILVVLTLYDDIDSTRTMIRVNVTADWVPELVRKLPDVVLLENSTLYNVFDLDDYYIDKDQDSLFFSSGYFNLKIDINENNTVDITALGHWTGSELVTFRAEDPTGAKVEDTITVTVLPVNDGPVISNVPDLVVHYDYSYAFDLSPYIFDPDNETEDLLVWTSESSDYIQIQQDNNLGIVVTYPESMNGMTIPVTIYVSDGLKVGSQEIQIGITDDFPPEIISELPDVTFNEDTVLENVFVLSNFFLDVDSNVLFYTNGTRFINISINSDLSVDFSAPENWSGSEIVTFRATDTMGALAEDNILVFVVPVNDAPTISRIPTQEKEEGAQWILDLTGYIDDIDNDFADLTISVQSDVGNAYVILVGNILTFQYPKDVKEDIITVTVSDGELETSRSFIVSIKRSEQIVPSVWDLIPWPWVFSILLVAIGGAFAIYKKRSYYNVYEAFLIHEGGLPIAIATEKEGSELEDVVVSGMFTAVQDFIRDAFAEKIPSNDWELDEMKFGYNKILIERSKPLYLAVIFGGNGDKLRSRVKKLLDDIDKKYGIALEFWQGDMSNLVGIRDMVGSLISKKKIKKSQLKTNEDDIEMAIMVWDREKDEIIDELQKLSENHKPVLSAHVEDEKSEVFACPICGKEIKEYDPKCTRCGVIFVEKEDISLAMQYERDDNELI